LVDHLLLDICDRLELEYNKKEFVPLYQGLTPQIQDLDGLF